MIEPAKTDGITYFKNFMGDLVECVESRPPKEREELAMKLIEEISNLVRIAVPFWINQKRSYTGRVQVKLSGDNFKTNFGSSLKTGNSPLTLSAVSLPRGNESSVQCGKQLDNLRVLISKANRNSLYLYHKAGLYLERAKKALSREKFLNRGELTKLRTATLKLKNKKKGSTSSIDLMTIQQNEIKIKEIKTPTWPNFLKGLQTAPELRKWNSQYCNSIIAFSRHVRKHKQTLTSSLPFGDLRIRIPLMEEYYSETRSLKVRSSQPSTSTLCPEDGQEQGKVDNNRNMRITRNVPPGIFDDMTEFSSDSEDNA